MQSLIRRFGVEAATDIINFSRKQVYALKKVVEEEDLDCEFELRRSYDVYCNEHEVDVARDFVRASQQTGQEWAADVDFIEGDMAEQVSTPQIG